jgi:hypothetical protein
MPRRARYSKHIRSSHLSLQAELEVRLGRGSEMDRLAVLELDAHGYKLPGFWIASAVA